MIFAILKMTTADVYEYKNWAFHFPAGSNMGVSILFNYLDHNE